MEINGFLELIDITDIKDLHQHKNMIDISVKDDETFLLASGIVSHNSAKGSVLQARDSETEAVYSLRGKVKNAKKLSDLTGNVEWMDIMSILEIEPGNKKPPVYDKIIIASDADPDGHHIRALIINFFHRWFPHVIESGKLYMLVTPLVVCDFDKKRKYFNTAEEFQKFVEANGVSGALPVSNVKYLKGLGSLSYADWEYVMEHKTLFSVVDDRSADRYLDIAFGDNAQKRKNFLEGK